MNGGMLAFERQHIVRFFTDDMGGNIFLASHRIERYEASF